MIWRCVIADNIQLSTNVGTGEVLKTDDDGTAHWQYVKLAYGADNTQTRVTTAAPLPVDLRTDNLSGNLDVNLAASAATVTVDLGANNDVQGAAAEGAAVSGNPFLIAGDDGTNVKHVAVDSNGNLQVDLVTAAVTNAGTFAVQEDGAALTSLQTIDNSIFADDAAFTLASSSVNMAGAIRDDSLTTLTAVEGDAVPLRVSSTGALHVTGGGGGTEYNEDAATPATITGSATVMERDDALSTLTPVEGDWASMRCSAEGALWVQEFNSDAILADTASMDTNLGTIAGDTTSLDGKVTVGAGTEAAAIRVTLPTDGTGVVNAAQSGTWTLGANSGTDIGDVTINNATGASAVNIQDGGNSITVDNGGTFAVQAAQSGTWTLGANSGVDIGDVDVASISAGSNLIGDVGISGARTSGGTTLYKNIDVDESEDEIKGTAGQVYWIHAMNLSASVLYLKLYNATAVTVTVGTTVPDLTFPIPTQGDTNGAGFMLSVPNGIAFGTAITIACTTGVADNDSGAPGANVCVVNLGYA